MCANEPHSFKNVRKCAATYVLSGAQTHELVEESLLVEGLFIAQVSK